MIQNFYCVSVIVSLVRLLMICLLLLRCYATCLYSQSYKLINVSLRVVNHIKTLLLNDNIVPDMLACLFII